MPQFDTLSFFSQLFWVFSIFLVLYIILVNYVLPSLAITLKVRKKLTSADSEGDTNSSSIRKSLFMVKGEPILLPSVSSCRSAVTTDLASSSSDPLQTLAKNESLSESYLTESSLSSTRLAKSRTFLLWLHCFNLR